MRTLTVRLPENLVLDIEAEARLRKVAKSDVVRERLSRGPTRPKSRQSNVLDLIGDLIGSVEGLPPDLSARKKHYLKASGYGQNRPR